MGYWITSLALIAFGFLGAFSIGRPFFLVGLSMLVLGPLRRRPALFWPPLLAVVACNVPSRRRNASVISDVDRAVARLNGRRAARTVPAAAERTAGCVDETVDVG